MDVSPTPPSDPLSDPRLTPPSEPRLSNDVVSSREMAEWREGRGTMEDEESVAVTECKVGFVICRISLLHCAASRCTTKIEMDSIIPHNPAMQYHGASGNATLLRTQPRLRSYHQEPQLPIYLTANCINTVCTYVYTSCTEHTMSQ